MAGLGASERPQRRMTAAVTSPVLSTGRPAAVTARAGVVGVAHPPPAVAPAPPAVASAAHVPDPPAAPVPAPASGPAATSAPASVAARLAGPDAAGPERLLESRGDPVAAEVHLTSRPESASVARRLSRAVVARWGLTPVAETVELLVSELVGNAVRHTGARTFGLRMQRRRGWIRVEVRDPSRALPCLLPVRETDTSGRGLFLVHELSDRWGVDLLPRGKTTWFELRVADPPER